MGYSAGDYFTLSFSTNNPFTGATAVPDSAPSYVLLLDGVAQADWEPNLANPADGQYTLQGFVPEAASPGQTVEVKITVTVAGAESTEFVGLGVVDTRVADVAPTLTDIADAADAAQSAAQEAATNTQTLLDRLGAWAGAGLNTVLGAFRALAAKLAGLTPTDLSDGTGFDNTTDSLEALRDRGDAAWTTSPPAGAHSVSFSVVNAQAGAINGVQYSFSGGPTAAYGSTGAGNTGATGLNTGTYTLTLTRLGYQPLVVTGIEITGDTELGPYTLEALTLEVPDAGQTIGWAIVRDAGGAAAADQTIEYRVCEAGEDGTVHPGATQESDASDAAGLVQIRLETGLQYQVRYGRGDWSDPFAAAGDTMPLPGLLGRFSK